MDISPQDTTTQPISDDQELAKALAGVLPDAPIESPAAPALSDAGTPTPAPAVPQIVPPSSDAPSVSPVPSIIPSPSTMPSVTPAPLPAPSAPSGDLDSIKKDALGELRPLIDKVDLPAEEKFDTYLMLIRSTDDSSLIAPAHAAAQAISDEKRKAEALLDVIKEIDYLSRKDQPSA